MKINQNIFGNYNIHRTAATNRPKKLENAQLQFSTDPINVDEKRFFTKMYPQKKEEIESHKFYQRNGKMTGVSVGSLFDMRG